MKDFTNGYERFFSIMKDGIHNPEWGAMELRKYITELKFTKEYACMSKRRKANIGSIAAVLTLIHSTCASAAGEAAKTVAGTSSIWQGNGKILITVLIVCFVSMLANLILGALGYKQISMIVSLVAVGVVIMETINMFNGMLNAIRNFVA